MISYAGLRRTALSPAPAIQRNRQGSISVSGPPRYRLKLFITAGSKPCADAMRTLRQICDEDLKDDCELVVLDVLEHPAETESAGVLVTPTVVKDRPPPIRKLIGDLSDKQKVLAGLEIALPETR
jgi:circadian clock protein KaiB